MSSFQDNAEASMKYESPCENDAGPQNHSDSSRKRRHSNQDPPEKRQRIDDDSSQLVTPEFAALVSQTAVALAGPPRGFNTDLYKDQGTNHLRRSGSTESDSAYDPHYNMRILSLPILESLSVQILSTLTGGSYIATVHAIADKESDFHQAYQTLVSLFNQTKKIYSQEAVFLSSEQLNIKDPKHKDLIRLTNVATFVGALFNSSLGLEELEENFLETFAPEGIPVDDALGELLVNLRTQMFLSYIGQPESEYTKEELLEICFPPTLRSTLESRHLLIPLAATEERYLKACDIRSQYLIACANEPEKASQLMAQYPWQDFLIGIRDYISKEPLVQPYAMRHALPHTSPPPRNHDGYYEHPESNPIIDDFSAQINFAAEAALNSIGVKSQSRALGSHRNHQQSNGHQSQADTSSTQPESTKALYDRARQAVVAKSNPGNARGRPGMPSQRRPWSTAEENALMTGLDQVKGPHWSQILGLYGPSGTINTVLKDRNQVQLKDKARNIKLFFLKSGFEVPSYLQQVTGELKTRAPTQAARREAEARARLAGDDELARVAGIGILAGGMQARDRAGSQDTLQSQSMSPSNSANQDGPEEFQVVEPEGRHSSVPAPQLSEDERLRQVLLNATNTVLASS